MLRTHLGMGTLTQRVADKAPFRWSECMSFVVLHCPDDESIVVWSTHLAEHAMETAVYYAAWTLPLASYASPVVSGEERTRIKTFASEHASP